MRRILCYGDSNTWGYIPASGARYEPDVRWTGVAQRLLGSDYTLIEEGMNGRTTVYENPLSPGRNGMEYLLACLISQKPLDMAVVMLGTNDLRWTDGYGAADGARRLVRQIRLYSHLEESSPIFVNGPKVLLVAPILAHESINERDVVEHRYAFPQKSRDFARAYGAVAKELGVDFLDAALYAKPSAKDGLHMEPEDHRALGEAMARKIREMMEKA
ncbi:MAG: SGNH/GDSL hydrolase family protein [Clostridiales bacterium]|nr:SGNH/GDSL hydrolase family protein [Clostridiales bacterium]